MSSSFGNNIKLTIFGQSHSKGIGMTLEGIPAGKKIDYEKLYSFMLSEQVLEEFAQVATEYRQKYIAKHFNSLEILQNCLLKK